MASALNRTQAVRDTQLLWIPAAGLESLAIAAPRAFISLVWRMGARSSGGGGGRGDVRNDVGGADFAGIGSAAGIGRSDSGTSGGAFPFRSDGGSGEASSSAPRTVAVSYTHLTLPTILLV